MAHGTGIPPAGWTPPPPGAEPCTWQSPDNPAPPPSWALRALFMKPRTQAKLGCQRFLHTLLDQNALWDLPGGAINEGSRRSNE